MRGHVRPAHARAAWIDRFGKDPRIAGAALAAITFIFYIPALAADYVWDDAIYLTSNPAVTSARGLLSAWIDPLFSVQYYPLLFSSFYLEHKLWGFHPAGYHAVNVIMHAAISIVLWRLLVRLKYPAAWAGAAIFALHPANVTTVAWITERKNLQSAFFCLLAAHAWVRFVESPKRLYFFMTLALFALMLLAKPATVPMIFVLLLLSWHMKKRLDRRDVLAWLPLAALSLAAALFHIWVESHHLTTEEIPAAAWPERIIAAGRALWHYAAEVIWPASLMALHPQWSIDSGNFLPYLFPLTAAIVPITLFLLRKRIGSGPFVAVSAFGLMISPVLGLVPFVGLKYAPVWDHHVYLPAIGLIVLVSSSVALISYRNKIPQPALVSALSVLLLLLGVLSWRHARVYENLETLMQHSISRNPDSPYAYTHLVFAMREQGRIPEAIEHLNKAIQLDPENAQAHAELGYFYMSQRDLKASILHSQRAVEINPRSTKALNNLGLAFVQQNNAHAGVEYLSRAAELDPKYAEARSNLGYALTMLQRFDDAESHLQAAINLKPDYAEAHNNLGILRAAQQRMSEAIEQFEKALALDPNLVSARRNLELARQAQRTKGQ